MDEFSFPTIAVDTDSLRRLPFPHFAASPLRFLPSDEKTAACGCRRSFSSLEEAPRTVVGRRPGAEERMDVLWEDFNQEELLRRSPCRRDNVKFCCLQVVLNEKKSGRVGGRRRGSLTSMLKALKKLFLIPRASSSGRTPFC